MKYSTYFRGRVLAKFFNTLLRNLFSIHKVNTEVLPSGRTHSLCTFGEDSFIWSVSGLRVGPREPLICCVSNTKYPSGDLL